jgi:ATP-dependent protease HslVU (ClpYQ) peptidase subunit
MHATTILAVRKGSDVVVIGDGQKVRTIGNAQNQNMIITGFAGATADCFTLLELLEKKLEEHPGQLLRAAVELTKMWRTDKLLRNLEVNKDTMIYTYILILFIVIIEMCVHLLFVVCLGCYNSS